MRHVTLAIVALAFALRAHAQAPAASATPAAGATPAASATPAAGATPAGGASPAARAAPAAGLPSVTLPPALDRVLRDYERAWTARDPEALSKLFAEDGFVLASGRAPVRGRAAIREAYAKAGGPLHLRALDFAISGEVGYIIGTYAAAADKPDDGKFVLALKRAPGRWLIAADIDNSIERASPQAPAPGGG